MCSDPRLPLQIRSSRCDESAEPTGFVEDMPLIPLEPDDAESDAPNASVTLTGVTVSGSDREQILEALKDS